MTLNKPTGADIAAAVQKEAKFRNPYHDGGWINVFAHAGFPEGIPVACATNQQELNAIALVCRNVVLVASFESGDDGGKWDYSAFADIPPDVVMPRVTPEACH
jgi:hypothetical protein